MNKNILKKEKRKKKKNKRIKGMHLDKMYAKDDKPAVDQISVLVLDQWSRHKQNSFPSNQQPSSRMTPAVARPLQGIQYQV